MRAALRRREAFRPRAALALLAGVAAADWIANRVLRRRLGELERRNAQLEEFASMAAHELQEPVRKIVGFGDLLRSRWTARVPPEAQEDLERIQAAARRMAALTEALLRYSRLQARPLDVSEVDLREAADAALSGLAEVVARTGARVRVGALPRVRGDAVRLAELFAALLSNALKFHAAGVRPEVSIEARPAGRFWELRVTDNGIGFEPRLAEKIFEPFTRLHARHRYEGVGLGLASARRIAARHGGTLTAEGRPRGGSCFRLRLPRHRGEGGRA
ncbi:MAG: hypothetical protein HY553_19700 [Elusimicrobia bacterium]|nr:hypothetical protein [Elusimicrobiota bacterium]